MARKSKIENEVQELIAEVASSLGLDLYDLVFKRSGPRSKLQVFLSRPGSTISLDDCAKASRAISRELDLQDPIPQGYDLEVSSPGLDRPLRTKSHWQQAEGEKVRVRWRDDDGKVHTTIGVAVSIADQAVQISPDGEDEAQQIQLESVLSAKLELEW